MTAMQTIGKRMVQNDIDVDIHSRQTNIRRFFMLRGTHDSLFIVRTGHG